MKAVRLLPYPIRNVKNFLHRNHPELHPSTSEYDDYWERVARRCIEGYWGEDVDPLTGEGGWRWMPGNLYFYINLCKISFKEGQDPQPPDLRDLEWHILYGLITAEGFSGFDEDEEYTCNRIVDKIERDEPLGPGEEYLLNKHTGVRESFTKKDGTYKKYVEAREYLYKTHSKPLGKPYFFNEAKNFQILSTRGIGKSLIMANPVALYAFTFNGARTFEEWILETTKATLVVGAGDTEKSDELLDKFKMSEDRLATEIGAYNRDGLKEMGYFWRPSSGSLSHKSKSPKTKRVKLEGSENLYKGADVKLVHTVFGQKADKAVSYRALKILIDEIGLVQKILKILALSGPSQFADYKWGLTLLTGTGGVMEKIGGAQEVFENPRAYDFLEYKDDFNEQETEIGCFIPGYYIYSVYRDKNGNTDVERALEAHLRVAEEKKKLSPAKYFDFLVNYPILPQHMFLSNAGDLFDIEKIEDRLNFLNAGGWKAKAQVGSLHYITQDKSRAKFVADYDQKLTPITQYNQESKMEDWRGAVVMYEEPIDNAPPVTSQHPLYMVFYDQVMDDMLKEDVGTSLCAAYVFKKDIGEHGGIKYNVVAEWVGRRKLRAQNHEEVFKLAALYQSRIFPESNIKDFESYAGMTNRLHLLEGKPTDAIAKFNVTQKDNYDFGFKVTPGTIPMLEVNLSEMSELVTEYLGEEYDDDLGDFKQITKTFIDNCWSTRLLTEMKSYRRDGNFDAISAMFLCALWFKQQELKPLQIYDRSKEDSKMQKIVDLKYKQLQFEKNNNPAYSW